MPVRTLLGQGWLDAVRACHPDEAIYTYWDYFRQRWQRNSGLRIDHLLLSPTLQDALQEAGVHRWVRDLEKTSDHAPTWIRFKHLAERSGVTQQVVGIEQREEHFRTLVEAAAHGRRYRLLEFAAQARSWLQRDEHATGAAHLSGSRLDVQAGYRLLLQALLQALQIGSAGDVFRRSSSRCSSWRLSRSARASAAGSASTASRSQVQTPAGQGARREGIRIQFLFFRATETFWPLHAGDSGSCAQSFGRPSDQRPDSSAYRRQPDQST